MERYQEIEKELAAAQKELEALIAQLRIEYPEYEAIKYPTPLKADQIKLEPGEVLLSFQATDKGVLWYLVRNGQVAASNWVALPRLELNRLIKDYRAPFENLKSRKDLAHFDARLSKRLYELLLLKPLEKIDSGEKIIIVPDGLLGLLPFEALVMAQIPVKYVSDEHDLTYAHSGTSLSLARTLNKGQSPTRPMLVLADPVFDRKDARIRGQVKVAQKDDFQTRMMRAITSPDEDQKKTVAFPRLEETGHLALELEKIFSPQTEILTGLEATKKNLFKKPLDQYRFLVATHGVLDGTCPTSSSRPWFSPRCLPVIGPMAI